MNTIRNGRQGRRTRTAFPDQIRTITMTDIATRSTKMYLIQEDLARAHIRKLQDEAAAERVASGLVRVRKAVRKAHKARLYARRALASAISYD